MQGQYKSVFSIEVIHSYYENSVCRGLNFVPSNETRNLMQRYNFLQSSTDNILGVYCNSTQSTKDLLSYLLNTNENPVFEFEIQTSDPNFYAFTKLSVEWNGRLEYSSASYSTEEGSSKFDLSPNYTNEGQSTGIFVSIHIQDLINAITAEEAVSYTITMEANATQWQYYIINNSPNSFGSLQIYTGSEVTFNGPEEVALPNNQKAKLYTSDSLLSLSEVPMYKFKLIDASGRASTNDSNPIPGKVVFNGLPNPNPAQTGISELDGVPVPTSPMYIYI